ncbi:MAG: poly(3-hydroxyalkanoate) synthetase, partial [Caldisericota bacterium]|nr:poly(3-hydroxyalkanoate) synthetase [Caldisericota bacterium]
MLEVSPKLDAQDTSALVSNAIAVQSENKEAILRGLTPAASGSIPSLSDVLAYQRDFWERSILFWDTLRER